MSGATDTPSVIPEWAISGTHIVDPGSGIKTTGFVEGPAYPEHANWILNALTQWALFQAQAVLGTLIWSGRYQSSGGSGWTIPIDPIELLVTNDGAYPAVPAHSLAANAIDTGTVANNQWYYIYVQISGTGAQFQYSLTAPVGGDGTTGVPGWKAGSVGSLRFIGCFRTNGSAQPIPFYCVRGRYVYRRSAVSTALTLTGSGSATSPTVVDLSGYVPPHSQMARVEMSLHNPDTVAQSGIILTHGDVTDSYIVYASESGATTNVRSVEIQTSASQTIDYQVGAATTTAPVLTLSVEGWE